MTERAQVRDRTRACPSVAKLGRPREAKKQRSPALQQIALAEGEHQGLCQRTNGILSRPRTAVDNILLLRTAAGASTRALGKRLRLNPNTLDSVAAARLGGLGMQCCRDPHLIGTAVADALCDKMRERNDYSYGGAAGCGIRRSHAVRLLGLETPGVNAGRKFLLTGACNLRLNNVLPIQSAIDSRARLGAGSMCASAADVR